MDTWWQVLVSALGGSALTGALALWGAHQRERWSDRTRWLDLRRDLAVRFLEAADDLLKWTTAQSNMSAFAETGGTLTIDGVSDRWEAMRRVHEADMTVQHLNTEIDLVGTDDERVAAARLRAAVWKLAAANGRVAKDDESKQQRTFDLEGAVREQHAAREHFRETARRGLVPSRLSMRRRSRSRSHKERNRGRAASRLFGCAAQAQSKRAHQ
jgi:hypothetical protein